MDQNIFSIIGTVVAVLVAVIGLIYWFIRTEQKVLALKEDVAAKHLAYMEEFKMVRFDLDKLENKSEALNGKLYDKLQNIERIVYTLQGIFQRLPQSLTGSNRDDRDRDRP